MNLELVYIGEQTSRFIYGNVYTTIHLTEDTTTLLDKDKVPMCFSNYVLHYYFRQKDKWRDEKLTELGIL